MTKLDSSKFREVLSTINSSSCPYLVNLHSHTIFSDGSLTPIELINQAISMGLEHIAITAHHSIEGYLIALRWLKENSQSIRSINLWSGIEISCLINKCLVHILGYCFDPKSDSLRPYINGESPIAEDLRASNVIKAIHKSGGIAILAHPARYRLDYKTIIDAGIQINLDGVEAWYDYEMTNIWKPSEFICQKILEYSSKYNMLITCGTDTHGTSLNSR